MTNMLAALGRRSLVSLERLGRGSLFLLRVLASIPGLLRRPGASPGAGARDRRSG